MGVCLVFWGLLGVFVISPEELEPMDYLNNLPLFRVIR